MAIIKNIKNVRRPVLLRIAGGVAILYVALGLLAGLLLLTIVPGYESSFLINPEVKEKLMEYSGDSFQVMLKIDFTEFEKALTSKKTKRIFYLLAIPGLIFNALSAFLGYKLIRARAGAIAPFIGFMAIFVIFHHVLKNFLFTNAVFSEHIGKIGIIDREAFIAGFLFYYRLLIPLLTSVVLTFSSYFWLWGSALVLLAVFPRGVKVEPSSGEGGM